MSTKIEWATEVWNPVTGCTPISEGCTNCYAKRMAQRLKGRFGYPEDDPFRVTFHPDRLDQPLKWKKPRQIFVVSMGDLFHEDIPGHVIHEVMKVVKWSNQHTFLILTKRPDRMRNIWMNIDGVRPQNVWLGVTAENQQTFSDRWLIAQQIPASVLWVSMEPLLSPIQFLWNARKPDWVVLGGESGPGARPLHPDWVRSIRDQCQEAGVPFFFKQWGNMVHTSLPQVHSKYPFRDMGDASYWLSKKKAGRLLDGKEHSERPN